MTDAKFTPGPWVTDKTTAEGLVAVRAESSKFALCTFSGLLKNTEEDARLISAAPDLYEALQETLGVLESEFQTSANIDAQGSHIASIMRPLWLRATAALAKAASSQTDDTPQALPSQDHPQEK